MGAQEMLKVQKMKEQEREKEEKRKKNEQKKEDMKAAFLQCKDKCVCEGRRKLVAATGLKMCELCSNVFHSTGKWEMAYNDSACLKSVCLCCVRLIKKKLWYDESDSDKSGSDNSEQSSFLDEHDVDNNNNIDET